MTQRHSSDNLILCPTKTLAIPNCFNWFHPIYIEIKDVVRGSNRSFWWKSQTRTHLGLGFCGLTISAVLFKLPVHASVFNIFLASVDVRRFNKSATPLLMKYALTVSSIFNLTFHGQKILFLFFFWSLFSVSTTPHKPLDFQKFYCIIRYYNLRSDITYDLLQLNSTHV